MRNVASLFKIALYVTVVLMAVAVLVTLTLELTRPSADRVPLLQLELDMFKTILAGFVVGMLGILIPALASETRERFGQRRPRQRAERAAGEDRGDFPPVDPGQPGTVR